MFNICVLFLISLSSADIISTVEFNHDGEFLATGDKGGRVVIFQRDGTKMRVRGTIEQGIRSLYVQGGTRSLTDLYMYVCTDVCMIRYIIKGSVDSFLAPLLQTKSIGEAYHLTYSIALSADQFSSVSASRV